MWFLSITIRTQHRSITPYLISGLFNMLVTNRLVCNYSYCSDVWMFYKADHSLTCVLFWFFLLSKQFPSHYHGYKCCDLLTYDRNTKLCYCSVDKHDSSNYSNFRKYTPEDQATAQNSTIQICFEIKSQWEPENSKADSSRSVLVLHSSSRISCQIHEGMGHAADRTPQIPLLTLFMLRSPAI